MGIYKYDVSKDGVINAIRIYNNDNIIMADLAFSFGGMVTIYWTNIEQRKIYLSGINGYTLIFDEREKADFYSFIKQKSVSLQEYENYFGIEFDEDFIKDNTELLFCYQNGKDLIDYDWWTHLQSLLNRKISYLDYEKVDCAYDGSLMELGTSDIEEINKILA